MFSKIIEFFYPFTNNPKDFKLKHKHSFLDLYFLRTVLYSGNGGKSWKKIYEANPPLFTHDENILEFDWSLQPLVFDFRNQDFNSIKLRFKSVNDILIYEKKEREKYLLGKKVVKKQRELFLEKLNRNLK